MPFTPPRQPMPGADPQAALRSLLGMGSISNVSGLSDRGLDVATGLDQFEPSEQELIDAQNAIPATRSGSFATPSREQLRETAMSKVKALLGMQGIKHQQQMDIERQKAQTAAEAFARQQAALDQRANLGRDAQMAQLQARLDAADRAREDSQANQKLLQDERLAAQNTNKQVEIPATMEKELATAREGYGGMMNRFSRYVGLGDGGRQRYEGALTSWLSRAGKMDQLNNVVNAAKAQGQGLSWALQKANEAGRALLPYEQEYLKLVLGE